MSPKKAETHEGKKKEKKKEKNTKCKYNNSYPNRTKYETWKTKMITTTVSQKKKKKMITVTVYVCVYIYIYIYFKTMLHSAILPHPLHQWWGFQQISTVLNLTEKHLLALLKDP